MPANNIWDLAIEKMRETEKNESTQPKDSNIIFLGNRQSGKTSIIYRFVDRQEIAKPTLALEYLFGRRSRGLETAKEVCHIWELGGGLLFTNLLDIPITLQKLQTLSVAIVLDLSVPGELWLTMETLLQSTRARITDVMNSHAAKSKDLKKTFLEQAWKRIGDHEDKDMINPFPVPLVIFGSKYDLFQNIDPEKKKVISRCLRFVSHINGGMLSFISTKSENFIAKSRMIISHLVFGTSLSKTVISDYNKPIYIPFGGDSLKSIGNVPLSDDDSGKQYSKSIDMWKHIFVSHFPQTSEKLTIPDDPGKDPHFKERDIDMMRAEKDKELREYRQELQKKSKNYDPMNYE